METETILQIVFVLIALAGAAMIAVAATDKKDSNDKITENNRNMIIAGSVLAAVGLVCFFYAKQIKNMFSSSSSPTLYYF